MFMLDLKSVELNNRKQLFCVWARGRGGLLYETAAER